LFTGVLAANVTSFVLGLVVFGVFTPAPRPSISRVHADMRSLHSGLESYLYDYGRFPDDLHNLTTPIGYMTDIFEDHHLRSSKNRTESQLQYYPFLRLNPPLTGFLLRSAGPDGDYELPLSEIPLIFDKAGTVSQKALHALTYDPTNGMDSSGDIWRFRE
jgi:hypothetical protein